MLLDILKCPGWPIPEDGLDLSVSRVEARSPALGSRDSGREAQAQAQPPVAGRNRRASSSVTCVRAW